MSWFAVRVGGVRGLSVAWGWRRSWLRAAGHPVTDDPAEADVVVVSFDRTFDYAKLTAAYRAVRLHGAALVATNPDPYCPTPDGGLPDCAAMDLLAYRHRRVDPVALTRAVARAAGGPLIVAGSITSRGQIADVAAAGAWGFTIGSAIFEDRLPGGPGLGGQLGEVLAWSSGR